MDMIPVNIYAIFPQLRYLPTDRQRSKLWHLSSNPAWACVNLAVHLIVTSLILFALATAHRVGFNLNLNLLKCLQKRLPCGATLEIKSLCAQELACHMPGNAVTDKRNGQAFHKKIIEFSKLTEGGVNNYCVTQVPIIYQSKAFNQGINKTQSLAK